MSKAELNIKYNVSSFSKRKQPFSKQLKGKWINHNLLEFDIPNLIEGWIYYTEISEGFSVLLSNIKTQKPINFTLQNIPTSHHIIITYDISAQVNTYKIKGSKYTIENEDLRFSISDSNTDKIFSSNPDKNWNQIQLTITNDTYKDLIKNLYNKSNMQPIFDPMKDTIFHYGPIDTRSNLILNQLKNCSHLLPEFDLKLRGFVFSLLGNMIVFLSETKLSLKTIHVSDSESIMRSKEYIMARLTGKFPSVNELAALSLMSYSKYIIIFKKVFKMSPHSFFQNEKMNLAKTLLKTGDFNSITDIAYHLSFSNRRSFSEAYKNHFNELPSKLFVKK